MDDGTVAAPCKGVSDQKTINMVEWQESQSSLGAVLFCDLQKRSGLQDAGDNVFVRDCYNALERQQRSNKYETQ